jgi:pyruvate dehydrogenase E1 component alpha subunit
LISEGILTEESAKEIDRTAKQETDAAVVFADESPAPTIEDVTDDVYWESDNNTEASKIGRHFFND